VADSIIVRGAREHNLKDISLLPGLADPVNLLWPLTLFMLKDNGAM
jgi:hypothetical protein